jgi:hypothetical protein
MKTYSQQSTSDIRRPPLFIAHHSLFIFLLASIFLRAPALLRAAENLPLDSPRRAFCLAAMRPIASVSHLLKLDVLCNATESYERKHLE